MLLTCEVHMHWYTRLPPPMCPLKAVAHDQRSGVCKACLTDSQPSQWQMVWQDLQRCLQPPRWELHLWGRLSLLVVV